MSVQTELELSYLAAKLPNLEGCSSEDLKDTYFPSDVKHPKLRIRQRNNQYIFTKKTPITAEDASIQKEETISLSKEEFEALAKGDSRTLSKTRYFMGYQGLIAEIDIFKGNLEGLVIIEFEFKNKEEKDKFSKPAFCLADVTQENFIAGGVLAGKTYEEIRFELQRFNYQKL